MPRQPPPDDLPPRPRDPRQRHKGGPPRGRKTPPPEATGREADYLFRLRADATPVVVELRDGTRVFGIVEYYDRELIKIERPRGPHLLLRKRDVRSLAEGEATRPA